MDYFSLYNTLDLITMVFDETESIISLLEEMFKTKYSDKDKEQIRSIINAYSNYHPERTALEKGLYFDGIEVGLKLYLTMLEIQKDRKV